ncbi:hypothetical protein [Clostridium nigeriense]|uniref:hypothetical protein n=1 Tax=Clostridium nigeriense TaxID=1805470 RepID=UPI0008335E8C|nr:hypothetical protein [Clostridium nigeriense]
MIKKSILYLLVILLTLIQCFILINFKKIDINKDSNFNDSYGITKEKNAKYIKEIMRDFNDYNTLTILSYNKIEDGNWKLKCLLEGSKEEVLKDIGKLNYYNIISYSLNYENSNILLEVDLLSK